MAPCPHHDGIREILDDHEARLRTKSDRIMRLELEAGHMSEKMDAIIKQNEAIKTSLDSLRAWQLYLMGAAGTIALAYSLVSAHWGTISKLIGAGG
jgi:hypothetical protein